MVQLHFLFLLLFQVIVNINQCAGQKPDSIFRTCARSGCSYPASWQSSWWESSSNNHIMLRTFTKQDELEQDKEISSNFSITTNEEICYHAAPPFAYHRQLNKTDALPGEEQHKCVYTFIPGEDENDKQQSQLMVYATGRPVLFICNFGRRDGDGTECGMLHEAHQADTHYWSISSSPDNFKSPSLWFEGSSSLGGTQRARIYTPPIDLSSGACMKFRYFIHQNNINDALVVYGILDRKTVLFMAAGEDLVLITNRDAFMWNHGQVQIPAGLGGQTLVFEAEVSPTLGGEHGVGLDDISITRGKCGAPALVACNWGDLETGYTDCIFKQRFHQTQGEWLNAQWDAGRIDKHNVSAYPFAEGFYLYRTLVPDEFRLGSSVRMITPKILYAGIICVQFAVKLDAGGAKFKLWKSSENNLGWELVSETHYPATWHWRFENVSVEYGTEIAFEQSKLTEIGDDDGMASLDNVLITAGACKRRIEGHKWSYCSIGMKDADEIDASSITADNCGSLDGYISNLKVLLRHPFNFTIPCPFHSGHYLVELNDQCLSDLSSTFSINKGITTMHSCLSGNIYARPFWNSSFTCVGEIPADKMFANETDGKVLILAYNNDNGGDEVQNFYIARYVQEDERRILLSLQGTYSGKLTPLSIGRYDAYGHDDTHFAHKLVMTQYECASSPCMNGATCVQWDIGGYQCRCQDGSEGTYCETCEENGMSECGSQSEQETPAARYAARGPQYDDILIGPEDILIGPGDFPIVLETYPSSGKDHLIGKYRHDGPQDGTKDAPKDGSRDIPIGQDGRPPSSRDHPIDKDLHDVTDVSQTQKKGIGSSSLAVINIIIVLATAALVGAIYAHQQRGKRPRKNDRIPLTKWAVTPETSSVPAFG